jgi:hypothetical protein
MVPMGPDPSSTKVRSFQVVLALVVFTEYWTKALQGWALVEAADGVALAVVTLLAAAVVHGRWRRLAFVGFALLQTWYVWTYFPLTGNHRYLELVLAGLFALLDDRKEDERRLMLRSLQWIFVVVLFYGGAQKLVHGYYFQGQFLSYSLWRVGFHAVLGPLLPAQEFERLTSYVAAVGDGPYIVTSPAFLVVSNAIWIVEIALALLLCFRATRRFTWLPGLLFVVAMEVVAREFMFGIEIACAMLLFARTDVIRRAILPITILLAALVLMRVGLIPGFLFH